MVSFSTRDYQWIGSIGLSGVFIVLFAGLYVIAGQYQGTADDFPGFILLAGIILSCLLIVRELILKWSDYDFAVETGISEYLKGGESQYTITERLKRVSLLGIWTAFFFVLATVNFILAITICYPGTMYTLGVHNYRTLVVSTIAIDLFVFIVFVWVLGIPLGVF
jgi:hypothetical protein